MYKNPSQYGYLAFYLRQIRKRKSLGTGIGCALDFGRITLHALNIPSN